MSNMDQVEDVPTVELPLTPDKTMADAQDYRLITKASDEFERSNYDACIDAIKQLESIGECDIKLQHNKAVANFYKDNCQDFMTLLKILKELRLYENNPLNENDDSANTSSHFVLYNQAVIYYHRHMYNAAIDLLEPLLSNIDKYDENMIAMIGILELRLLLSSCRPKKAYIFLELLLQKLGINMLNLTTDEFNFQEALPRLDGSIIKSLKLMSLLTHVSNKKTISIPEDGSPEFSALKAHQYYLMKDFQMSAKQLMKINVSGYMNGLFIHDLNTLIANNMGVIHLRVRHYAIAANFFQNAIAFDKRIATNLRNTQLHHKSSAKSCEILYNLGIAMLHLRRPEEAFQCFLVPLKIYHINPRLWFRIAEACIMAHEAKRLLAEKHFSMNGSKSLFLNRIPYMENNESSAVLEPTMEFAALSLRNALSLMELYLKEINRKQFNDETVNNSPNCKDWRNTTDHIFCPPSRPVTKEAFNTLLSSIYAAYSYVCLRMGDYVTALEMANKLLETDGLSGAHKMLGHMYAGEALIMMEKLADARIHLEPTFVSNLNTFDFETKDWQVKSLDAAQNVLRYNLAVALFLQGDNENARSLLNSCTHTIVSHKVMAFKNIQASVKPSAYFGQRV
ncbi:CCR4-NOT transcription complex subunit 10 isoform 2-T2 [Cochliomyia hominivorax]